MNRVFATLAGVLAVLFGIAAAPVVLDVLTTPSCRAAAAQDNACLPFQATHTALELENLRLRGTVEALLAAQSLGTTMPAPASVTATPTTGAPVLDLDLQPQLVTVFGIALDVVLPTGWVEVQQGLYAPSPNSADGIAYLPWRRLLGNPLDVVNETLGLQLDAPIAFYDEGALTFLIYEAENPADGTRHLIAISDSFPTSLVVIVQTASDTLEAYRAELFLPALAAARFPG